MFSAWKPRFLNNPLTAIAVQLESAHTFERMNSFIAKLNRLPKRAAMTMGAGGWHNAAIKMTKAMGS